MHSRAYFNTELSHCDRDGKRAPHRSRGAVEGREKAVAGGISFLAPKPRQFFSHNGVVGIQDIAPRRVAKFGRAFGGGRDVEKEDRGQNTIGGIDRTFTGYELLDV